MEEGSKKRWSAGEREAAVILVSSLIIASSVLGLLVYGSISAYSGGSLLTCGAPCPAREALSLVSSTGNSPTSFTLKLVNAGYAAVSIATYDVKDTNGQTYISNNWSGPTIAPNTRVSINMIIDGKTFTFQTGHSYTIILITGRNNQFTLTVTA